MKTTYVLPKGMEFKRIGNPCESKPWNFFLSEVPDNTTKIFRETLREEVMDIKISKIETITPMPPLTPELQEQFYKLIREMRG